MRISSRTGFAAAALALSVVAGFLAACGGTEAECRFGADCESGQCSADGLCVVAGGGSSSGQTGASSGGASSSSGGTSSGGSSGASSSSGGTSGSSSSGSSGTGCVANKDGTITKEEVPMAAGLTGNFRFATDVTVDMAGVKDGTNERYTWDLSTALEGDHDVVIQSKPVAGTWFASDYPTGEYTAPLGETPLATSAVLQVAPTALTLLGIVTTSDTQPSSSTITNLAYDKPVITLQFPMTLGSTWTTVDATGSGTLGGYSIPFTGSAVDSYVSVVDKVGVLKTPYGAFPVMRVVTSFSRTSWNALYATKSKSIAFVSECAGTIAKVTSKSGETANDFTEAAEVQRLAIAP